MSTPRVLVVGVSGATWDVIDPLAAAGRLPNLARLRADGAWATLESVMADGDHHYRPQVAWASLATGVAPARHGITAFFHEADDLTAPTLWERFDAAGLTVGIVGWPGTWPPPPVRGFVVPSHLARDARTWPDGLRPLKELDTIGRSAERGIGRRSAWRQARALGAVVARHRLPPRTTLGLAVEAVRAGRADPELRPLLLRRAKLGLTTDVFLDLCRRFRPDLAALVTFHADFALHRYWRYREPERFGDAPGSAGRSLAGAVDRSFEDVDRMLGRILRRLRPEVIAIVSEHGMQAEPDSPELGPWFFGIRGDAVLDLVGLGGRAAVCPVARWIAYRPGAGPLPPGLAERLRAVTVAETGLPLFSVYQHGPDEVVIKLLLSGDVPRYARGDLESLDVVYGDRTVAFGDVARRRVPRRSAMHARDGILVLAGRGVRPGALGRVPLLDVTPTLLRAGRLPLPEGLDGTPLDVLRG